MHLLSVGLDPTTQDRLAALGLDCEPVASEADARARLANGRTQAVLLGPAAQLNEARRLRELAHDLRGSLALLRGHAELLLPEADAPLPPEQLAESLAAIEDAVARMTELVDRRIEPGPPADCSEAGPASEGDPDGSSAPRD